MSSIWSPRLGISLDGVDIVVGDILDAGALREALSGCDAVVHLAAVADVGEVALDPLRADLVNTRGTGVLLEAVREEGIQHFVYGSTIWVYSNAPGTEALDEDALPRRPNISTRRRSWPERCTAGRTWRLYGVEPTILRFGIRMGLALAKRRSWRGSSHALWRASRSCINGDGNQVRQFVYVKDLAEGIVASLTAVAQGRTYNLVGDETVSVREIAAIVGDLIGDVPIEHVPGRATDLAQIQISGRRAREELGWARDHEVRGRRRALRPVRGRHERLADRLDRSDDRWERARPSSARNPAQL